MADINSDTQIKDSILSTNEILLGNSTAKAMSTMYLNLAHAAGMASHNAVSNQQHLNILGAAAVAASASGLLRTTMADQVEKMTPSERLEYLRKLLTLSDSPATEAASTGESGDAPNGAASGSRKTETEGTSTESTTAVPPEDSNTSTADDNADGTSTPTKDKADG